MDHISDLVNTSNGSVETNQMHDLEEHKFSVDHHYLFPYLCLDNSMSREKLCALFVDDIESSNDLTYQDSVVA